MKKFTHGFVIKHIALLLLKISIYINNKQKSVITQNNEWKNGVNAGGLFDSAGDWIAGAWLYWFIKKHFEYQREISPVPPPAAVDDEDFPF